jgi:hypothetical protein
MASPSIDNYTIGKGNLYTAPLGTTTWTHRGNCPRFEFEIAYDNDKEHISSMEGVGKVDLTIAGKQSASLTIDLDEITNSNLQLALAGGAGTGGADGDIGSTSGSTLKVRLVQTNDYGPTRELIFDSVLLRLNGASAFIGEDFQVLSLTGKVNFDGTRFGYWNDIAVSA